MTDHAPEDQTPEDQTPEEQAPEEQAPEKQAPEKQAEDERAGKRKRYFPKPVKFILWTLFVIFVLSLLAPIGFQIERVYYRSIDAEDVPEKFTEWYDERENPLKALKLVRFQPEDRNGMVLNILLPRAEKLEAPFLMEIGRRTLPQSREDALFWTLLGKMRFHFDAMRCVGTEQALGLMKILYASLLDPELKTIILENPALVRQTNRRVLEWDADHPADYIPAYLCALTREEAVRPRDDWWELNYALRENAREFLATPIEPGTRPETRPETQNE